MDIAIGLTMRGRQKDGRILMTLETTLKVVGTRPIRPDGVEKVTGRANFGADRAVPGMLYGKIKRSPHAHARILGINADKALALAGVKAVVAEVAALSPAIAAEAVE